MQPNNLINPGLVDNDDRFTDPFFNVLYNIIY